MCQNFWDTLKYILKAKHISQGLSFKKDKMNEIRILFKRLESFKEGSPIESREKESNELVSRKKIK